MIPHIPVTASGATGNVAEWIRKCANAVNALIASDDVKLQWAEAPSAANDPGEAGQIAYESGFLYVCVADSEWQRVAIATW